MHCLLTYGNLMLWPGLHIDTGRDIPLAAILHISGLCLTAGVLCEGTTAKEFAKAETE